MSEFRKHLAWYAHGLFGASAFRADVNKLESAADVTAAVERFFLGANVDSQSPEEEYDVDYRQALG